MPIITRLVLHRLNGRLNAHTMNLEAEFSSNEDPSGARLCLSAVIADDPKITVEDLYKKSFDMLYGILKSQVDRTAVPPAGG